MSRDTQPDRSITTSEAFESALSAVVEKAIEADVDVRGAWDFKTRGSTHYWEVEVCELARQVEDDD